MPPENSQENQQLGNLIILDSERQIATTNELSPLISHSILEDGIDDEDIGENIHTEDRETHEIDKPDETQKFTIQEQFNIYRKLCEKISEKGLILDKETNHFVYLKSENSKSEVGDELLNLFRVAEFDIENEKVFLQKSNEIDLIGFTTDSLGFTFFKSLTESKQFNEIGDILNSKIRIIPIKELEKYNVLIVYEHIFYHLKNEGKDNIKIFYELYEFSEKTKALYSILNRFQNSLTSMYISLILFYLDTKGLFYDFEKELILQKEERINNSISNLFD